MEVNLDKDFLNSHKDTLVKDTLIESPLLLYILFKTPCSVEAKTVVLKFGMSIQVNVQRTLKVIQEKFKEFQSVIKGIC